MRSLGPLKHTPAIVSANRVHDAPLGPKHTMLLFDNIKAEGDIQYTFLLMVIDNATQEPVYFVSSEVNAMVAVCGGGSHYLCTFSDAGHGNLGGSNDWGDPNKFFPQAIRIAAEHLGVSPEEVGREEEGESISLPELLDAAAKGDIASAKALLTKGADVNEKSEDGMTALILASLRGRVEIVEVLLVKGADVNAKSSTGHTALMFAANQGHANQGHAAIVKTLLGKGAEANARAEDGNTALLLTALAGHAEIVKMLLNKGADVNARTEHGITTLMWAALKGPTETVKALLNAGADVNAKTVNGSTALMLATDKGRTEIVQLLKQAGARSA